ALPGAIWTMLAAAGFGEEVVFRGFLFERLGRGLGESRPARVAAVVIAATIFSAAHYPGQGWTGVEMAAITGLVFGAIFSRTKSLPFPMIAHAAFDLTAVAMIYWDVEAKFAHLFFR